MNVIKRRSRRVPGPKTKAPTAPAAETFSFPIAGPSSASQSTLETHIETVSPSSNKIRRFPFPIEAGSPVKRLHLESINSASEAAPTSELASEADAYTISLDDFFEPTPAENDTPKAKRKAVAADKAMNAWLAHSREPYLREMLWLEGRGFNIHEQQCNRCRGSASLPRFRCRDCGGMHLVCSVCIVDMHRFDPLHWVEEWVDNHFKKRALKMLGLRIQLGHLPFETCALPKPAHQDFTVLHHNGIHNVAVDFCGCHQHGRVRHDLQLLRNRWFPSTNNRPQSCATFACLDAFHAITLHSKCTPYDYYQALEYLTDGSGRKPLNRYRPLLRMQRQYRHLLMLKRRGRGHAVSGAAGTAVGELAIRCPVCPRPEVNLPADWAEAPPEDQGLYTQFLAMDACFALKRRLISNDYRDPPLSSGMAYMVEWEPYRQHILTITDEKEITNCSDFAGVRLREHQVFQRICGDWRGCWHMRARHEFVQPTGVGDLQRGERFGNMDYILGSFLRHINEYLRKLFSYDIACQWGLELEDRLRKLPEHVRHHLASELVQFAVPKMHIKGHILPCQIRYSLALLLGAGQTDGEGIERLWAAIAGVAGSTKLSGPGTRSDQLDDHWQFWNWRKLVGMAESLRRKSRNAEVELERQEAAFSTFSVEQAEHVPRWLEIVKTFEADNSKPNPYESTHSDGLTEKEVRAQLDEQDQAELAKGAVPLHDISPTDFIVYGLEVEEEQRRLSAQAQLKQKKEKIGDKIRLKKPRNKLKKQYQRWRELQATYMPSASLHFNELGINDDTRPENLPLILPTALPPALRDGPGCKTGLLEIERRLRHAQCKSALIRLRAQLHNRWSLLLYKKRHSRHQGPNTRSRALIERNETKIKTSADCYQAARAALARIEPSLAWPVLRAADIRCMEDADELSKRQAQRRRQLQRRLKQAQELVDLGVLTQEQLDEGMESDDDDDEMEVVEKQPGAGESRRELSWIWTLAGVTGSEEHFQEALRIEWSKAFARTRRWREEHRYLNEEWRRLPLSLQYEEELWSERARLVGTRQLGDDVQEGMKAYALKQAAMYSDLVQRAELTKTEEWAGRGHRRGKMQVAVKGVAGGAAALAAAAGMSASVGGGVDDALVGDDWEDQDEEEDGDYDGSDSDSTDEESDESDLEDDEW
ncbi:CxC2 domain-containing protein [Mycena chlorophos]|uniref:CxC2 domain-containing protein n=1 Tax=Mycena chlorophos TaxID=658473 RepID=A0A8H6TRM2_MYCCL|nr:CxC2 domain-containing protein [Mycena chlorophos]